jgi:hypothetical protein
VPTAPVDDLLARDDGRHTVRGAAVVGLAA